MRQPVRWAPDLTGFLLCCGDRELDLLAAPLRQIDPEFRVHPVVLHVGSRLSRCPHLIAEAIERAVERFPYRPYQDVQADLAAATLTASGQQPKAQTSLYELEADVIRVFGSRRHRNDLEELALGLARMRRPFVSRARLLGVDVAACEPLFITDKVTGMPADHENASAPTLWAAINNVLGNLPFLREILRTMDEELQKLGRVNILIAGKTGVGKSTLVNAIFGESVARTGMGRPVSDGIRWYEPKGLPVRLCDTQGLELEDFGKILAGLEAEIERGIASGKIEDRVHVLWLCILEPEKRVQTGEKRIVELCQRHKIPAIVVLTQAIGPREFAAVAKELIPEAKAVVRVLAEGWEDPVKPAFGLSDLVRATDDVLPEATRNAFDSIQQILLGRKRRRALDAVAAASATAAAAAWTPIPVADAGAVLAVNVGMIATISAIMGIQMSYENVKTLGVTMVGAMAAAGGGRLIAGELLKLVPGIGSLAGGTITSAIAASATYGLGYGYVEFLCAFHSAEHRMPDGDEIRDGFTTFWQSYEQKDRKPPGSTPTLA
jgi:uncharacterized protein (DUF697 family)/GTP-binding protein EngB required for normal cell division